jgi:hypothetical protein
MPLSCCSAKPCLYQARRGSVLKPFMVLTLAFLFAQPATATNMVQLQPVAAACAPGAANCRPAAQAPATDELAMSPGQIVAGLAGLLVLGLVFGRRRSVLPQVVS